MAEICRACLQPVVDASDVYYLDAPESNLETLTLGQKLTACVPELIELPSLRAALCWSCTTALRCAYGFRQQCLQTEQKILNFLQHNDRDTIYNLGEVAEVNSNSNVCCAEPEECIDIEQLSCLRTEAQAEVRSGDQLNGTPSHAGDVQLEPSYNSVNEWQECVVVDLLSSPPVNKDAGTEQECPSVGSYYDNFEITAMKNDIMSGKLANRNGMPASPTLLLQELLKEHTYYCSRCNYSTKKINRYQLHKRVHLAQRHNH